MAFNNEEILTLAKAGFTAQQIAALANLGSPAQATETTQQPAPEMDNKPAPAPAPQATEPEGATAADPAPASDKMDALLAEITGIKTSVQNMFLQNASQAGNNAPRTSEQILAEIINPTYKKGAE